MTDQKVFDIAEWLVYNSDSVTNMLKDDLNHMIDNRNKMADTPIFALQYKTEILNRYEDKIMLKVAENMKLNYDELALAFADERVRIILDRYYLRSIE